MDDSTYRVIDLILKGLGLVGIFTGLTSFWTARRAHLFSTYTATMAFMDDHGVRASRAWVYDLRDRELYEKEEWIKLDVEPESGPDKARWENKQRAERVARSFDRLGLLVREGRVPINLIAQFYVTPILRCFWKLGPYIQKVRDTRDQRGHMWEFENLAIEIVSKGVRSGHGVWKGIDVHESLYSYKEYSDSTPTDLLELKHLSKWDAAYTPGEKLWYVRRF